MMNSPNTSLRITMCLFLFLSISSLRAQPERGDYLRTSLGMGLFLSMQYGWIDAITPETPRFTKPNNVDQFARSIMRWDLERMNIAKKNSDILLYGVFLGGTPVTPLLSKKYIPFLLLNTEVMAINGILTNLVKVTAARQRPASFFGTRDEGHDSYMSFFSGHTSHAFAIGTSTALMLANEYPDDKNLIWTVSMSLASATGYYRIAADKHYLTDVLFGAVAGSIIGYTVYEFNRDRYWENDDEESDPPMTLRIQWIF